MCWTAVEWVILGISSFTGILFGSLGIKFAGPTNIVSTALIGAYGALQTVASLGYEFTEGLGVGDTAEGSCYCKPAR